VAVFQLVLRKIEFEGLNPAAVVVSLERKYRVKKLRVNKKKNACLKNFS